MSLLISAPLRPSSSLKPAFQRGSWLRWTIAFALCLAAGLVGIEAWQLWHVRGASLNNAKIVTASLAESLSQQSETTLKTADTVVGSLVQRVEAEGATPESLQRLYGMMTSLAAALPAIHEMGITDKNGNAIVKSLVPHPVGMNYSERDYFQFLKMNDTRDVFIGQPVRSKIDGTLNTTVSRRVKDRQGNFAGVVVSSVSMDFFHKLFESVQVKSGRFIAMVADNGTVLASSPAGFGDSELVALMAAPADALEYNSPKDGTWRVGAYKHLANYPMSVMVVEDSAAILSDWYDQLRVHGTIMLCVLILIGALGYRVDQAARATRLQALRDGLTGLANRRCFNETIELEFRRAQRSGQPLSLILADIDLFKNYNDHYGHPAGDSCLRAICDSLNGVLQRPGDLAARYGGEEIAILLPRTDIGGAMHVVEDIRAALQDLGIRHDASPHGLVTLSLGVACWYPRRQTATSGWLVGAADAALYAAKAAGRNTFTVHRNAEPSKPVQHGHAA